MWIYPLIVRITLWIPHSQLIRYSPSNQTILLYCCFYEITNKKPIWYHYALITCFYARNFSSFLLSMNVIWSKLNHDFHYFSMTSTLEPCIPILRYPLHTWESSFTSTNFSILLLLWNYQQGIGVLGPFALNIVTTQATYNPSLFTKGCLLVNIESQFLLFSHATDLKSCILM